MGVERDEDCPTHAAALCWGGHGPLGLTALPPLAEPTSFSWRFPALLQSF